MVAANPAPPIPVARTPRKEHRILWITNRRNQVFAGGITIGLVVGAAVRGLLPPFILDDEFWRDFWSGPPTAGLFAVVGAAIAYAAASTGARTAKRGAERQEWWDRAEWALNLARSTTHVDRLIGLGALSGLERQATEAESEMISAVVQAVAGEDHVDNGEPDGEDGGRRFDHD